MIDFWVAENRVVKETAHALFRDRADADAFVKDSFDLRVIAWTEAVAKGIVPLPTAKTEPSGTSAIPIVELTVRPNTTKAPPDQAEA